MLARIPGRAYLIGAVIIFAAANSIVRILTEVGEQNLIDGRNPISFCNVLFVGNICALITLLFVYRNQLQGELWQQSFQASGWVIILVSILSGAFSPALTFRALDLTSVNNVVLIGRLEPALTLALSILILKEKTNFWVILGAVVSFIGVGLTVVLQEPSDEMMKMAGMDIGRAELFVVISAVCLSISTLFSKSKLSSVPLGVYTISRTMISTVVFFMIVMWLYGISHFTDVFAPILWPLMLVYGGAIVVGGQLLWFSGLRKTNASEVSLASSFSPLAGILAAFLILGEVPTTAQWIGGSVILIGIAINQVGVRRQVKQPVRKPMLKSQDMDLGFKGV